MVGTPVPSTGTPTPARPVGQTDSGFGFGGVKCSENATLCCRSNSHPHLLKALRKLRGVVVTKSNCVT